MDRLGFAGLLALLFITHLPLSNAAAQAAEKSDEPARASEEHEKKERGEVAHDHEKNSGRDSDADTAKATVEEKSVSKRDTVTVGGRRVSYTATPGTLTLRDDEGAPIASMFYVAYVADRAKDAPERPVTFFFNGGPGSSTMWLHMGSFAPVRVETPNAQTAGPAPFRIVPNSYSLIDRSDLVFLDAIGTGLSRALGKAKEQDFWGVDQDIDAFAKGILRYLTINNRWNSPKYILGESYGTLRAAGLVHALQERGAQLNGVILLSSILNYGIRSPGTDQIFVNYLPSYAAVAWYHNKIPDRPATLEPFLTEVREYARGPYLAALVRGDDLPEAERTAIAQQLSRYTGLSPNFILRNNLRVDLGRFRKELLRDQNRTVGRLDARFQGIDVDSLTESPDYDASDAAISGAYIAALNSYLFARLSFRTDLFYRPNFREINRNWNQKHLAPGAERPMAAANTAIDLGRTMRMNPHLRVLSLNGYYDLATPFGGIEYDLKHLWLEPTLRKNVEFAYFESGHMIYIHPDSLAALKARLDRFYGQ
jgi:carboxypeptidase C (cathepsin A)